MKVAKSGYHGSGAPPNIEQLMKTAEKKMMIPYVNTCKAIEESYKSTVKRTQIMVQKKLAKSLNYKTTDAHGIFEPLVHQSEPPKLNEDGTVTVGTLKLSLGSRAYVVKAYWNTIHAADKIFSVLTNIEQCSTADDTVLHTHKILIADKRKVLVDAYHTMERALCDLRRSLLPSP